MAKIEREYTPELAAAMKADYLEAGKGPENVEARQAVVNKYVEQTGYGVFSVRGKMSRDGYYIAKPKVGKDGKTPAVRKEVLVQKVVGLTGLNPIRMETLANANKQALQDLVDYLVAIKEDFED